jgi:predicted metalloprotease
VRALEAEVASWTLRERELRRELAGVRAGRPDASEPSSLAEGELRDAISAARAAGRDRRPRWMDDLLGDAGREDQP